MWRLTVSNSCDIAASLVRLRQKKQAKWEGFKIALSSHGGKKAYVTHALYIPVSVPALSLSSN